MVRKFSGSGLASSRGLNSGKQEKHLPNPTPCTQTPHRNAWHLSPHVSHNRTAENLWEKGEKRKGVRTVEQFKLMLYSWLKVIRFKHECWKHVLSEWEVYKHGVHKWISEMKSPHNNPITTDVCNHPTTHVQSVQVNMHKSTTLYNYSLTKSTFKNKHTEIPLCRDRIRIYPDHKRGIWGLYSDPGLFERFCHLFMYSFDLCILPYIYIW